jgi:DNA modification methylase
MSIKRVTPVPGIDLYLGDCQDVMRRWDSRKDDLADMVLMDPPYGIDYVQESTGKKLANDKEPPLWSIDRTAALLKPNSPMYVFTRWDVFGDWQARMKEQGLRIKHPIIWVKGAGGVGDCLSGKALNYEMLIEAHKGRPMNQAWVDYDGWKGRVGHHPSTDTTGRTIKRDDSVWVHNRPKDKDAYIHPTTKPVDLMERAILNNCVPGGTVLDPFMGSGPVAVAAYRTGRKYIGIELEEEYFDLAVRNVRKAVAEGRG